MLRSAAKERVSKQRSSFETARAAPPQDEGVLC
jgi:hypothetical protein